MIDNSVLLFGASGQLGKDLHQTLSSFANILVPKRSTADFLEPQTLGSIVREATLSLIINAAAYTAVDKAEEEHERAVAINTIAPKVLAEEAEQLSIPLIHYSTDFVFAGDGDRPYLETDQTAPLNIYGRTKRNGEDAIRKTEGAHLIFRTSWVYAKSGQNFLHTMERLFQEREKVTVVDDQIGTPNWSRSLAEATAKIVRQMLRNPERFEELSGTYHMTGSGQTSWHGLATAYFSRRKNQGVSYRCKFVDPISTTDYPTAARRTAYSVLDSTKLEKAFGVALPHWEEQLDQFLDDTPPGE